MYHSVGMWMVSLVAVTLSPENPYISSRRGLSFSTSGFKGVLDLPSHPPTRMVPCLLVDVICANVFYANACVSFISVAVSAPLGGLFKKTAPFQQCIVEFK